MNEKAYNNLIMKIMHDESIFYSFMLNSAVSRDFQTLQSCIPVSIPCSSHHWQKLKKNGPKMSFLVKTPKIANWRSIRNWTKIIFLLKSQACFQIDICSLSISTNKNGAFSPPANENWCFWKRFKEKLYINLIDHWIYILLRQK